jgi:hypothetical protein
MDDGFYLVRRARKVTLGDAKTLFCYPYQFAEATDAWGQVDHNSEFRVNYPFPERDFLYVLTSPYHWMRTIDPDFDEEIYLSYNEDYRDYFWGSLPYYYFVQPDQMAYLRGYGGVRWTFGDPGVSSGDITAVTLRAYCQGVGIAIFAESGPTNAFVQANRMHSTGHGFKWIEQEYLLNPNDTSLIFSDISAVSDSLVYVVAADHYIYYYDGETWINLDETEVSRISAASDGSLYALRLADSYPLKWDTDHWDVIDTNACTDISGQSGSIAWVIRSGKLWKWDGSTWTQKTTTLTIDHISSRPDGTNTDVVGRKAVSGTDLLWYGGGAGWISYIASNSCPDFSETSQFTYFIDNSTGYLWKSDFLGTKTLLEGTEQIICVSVTVGGTIFVIDANGRVKKLVDGTYETISPGWPWADLVEGIFEAELSLDYGDRCRYFEARIDYIDGAGKPQQITIYPAADVATGTTADLYNIYDPQRMVGNPLYGTYPHPWDEREDAWGYPLGETEAAVRKSPCMQAVINCYGPDEIRSYALRPHNNERPPKRYRLTEIPTSGTITSVKVSFTAYAFRPSSAGATPKYWDYDPTPAAFVEIADGTYYGDEGNLTENDYAVVTNFNYTWATNPATGQAWTLADLERLFFGVRWSWPWQSETDVGLSHLKIEVVAGGVTYTTDAEDDPQWGSSRTFTCDLAELPAKGSTISSVKFHYMFGGMGGTGLVVGGLTSAGFFYWPTIDTSGLGEMRAFIIADGEIYYHTAYEIGDPESLTDVEWTMSTNPITGMAWTDDDLAGLKFGILFRNKMVLTYDEEEEAYLTSFLVGHIYKCHLEIAYTEAIETIEVSYPAISGACRLLSLTENVNTPTIQPDELQFSSDVYLPEREEIVLVHGGLMRFHGIVVGIDEINEGSARSYVVNAKSQAVMLEFRYIPGFGYAPGLTDYDGSMDKLPELFTNDIPVEPFNQNVSMREPWYRYEGFYGADEYGISRMVRSGSKIGIIWLINSMIPPGSGELVNNHVAKFAGLGYLAAERYLFTTNHGPVMLPDGYEIVGWLTDDGNPHPGVWNWYFLTCNMIADDLQCNPDYIGGLHRLGPQSSFGNLDRGGCWQSGQDLYVHTGGHPDAMLICIDQGFDTHLRSGVWQLANYELNAAQYFQGKALTAFSEFFEKLGQELRFRNDTDGNVYIDSASQIGHGSETDPCRTFVGGVDCKILVNEPSTPLLSAVLAATNGNQYRLSTDWKQQGGAWATKYLTESDRNLAELQEYVDLIRGWDDYQYRVIINSEEWDHWPGDWIEVQPEHYGKKAVRIQKILITPGRTVIYAGKELQKVDSKFGEWRNELSTANRLRLYEKNVWTFTGDVGSGSKEISVTIGDNEAKQTLQVSIETADGTAEQELMLRVGLQTTDYPANPEVIIPPGRIRLLGTNSIEIELSPYFPKYGISDVPNHTVTVYLEGGSSANTVTCTVNEYKVIQEVSASP